MGEKGNVAGAAGDAGNVVTDTFTSGIDKVSGVATGVVTGVATGVAKDKVDEKLDKDDESTS